MSAFHLVLSEQSAEDAEMSKCKSSVQRVRKLEKDVDTACSVGKHTAEQSYRSNTLIMEVRVLILFLFSAKDPKRNTLAKELEEEENVLKQCIEKLKLVEASRVALVSQLKEALHEQVSYTLVFNIFSILLSFRLFLTVSFNCLWIFVLGI